MIYDKERKDMQMNENKNVRNIMLAEKVIKGLQSRNMEGYFAQTKEDVLRAAYSHP